MLPVAVLRRRVTNRAFEIELWHMNVIGTRAVETDKLLLRVHSTAEGSVKRGLALRKTEIPVSAMVSSKRAKMMTPAVKEQRQCYRAAPSPTYLFAPQPATSICASC